jgi:hypothetical protein
MHGPVFFLLTAKLVAVKSAITEINTRASLFIAMHVTCITFVGIFQVNEVVNASINLYFRYKRALRLN